MFDSKRCGMALLVLMSLLIVASCGGGAGSQSVQPPPPTGGGGTTPPPNTGGGGTTNPPPPPPPPPPTQCTAPPPPQPVSGWVGIPAPSFGITETAGAANCFVNPTFVGATDSNNPKGTATQPRLTIPSTLAAGDVCEVQGAITLPSSTTITLEGTQEAPAIIKGVNTPVLTGAQSQVNFAGQYFIVEGLKFVNTRIRLAPPGGGDVHHAVLRKNELTGWGGSGSTNVIGLNTPGNGSRDVVIYQNEIHDNGSLTGDGDIHAFKVGGDSLASRVWYLENNVYRNGGDAIQVGSVTAVEPWPNHIYIGKNVCHEDRENCVDVKQARDVVISQNTMYGYKESGSAHGEAVVVHDGAQRVWVINNTIRDSRIGVIGTGMTDDLFILGNVIHGIVHDPVADASFTPNSIGTDGASIHVRGLADGKTAWIANNTIYRSDRGIHCADAAQACMIQNNVVYGLKYDSTHYGFANTASHSASTISNNLMKSGGTETRVQIGSTRYTSLAAYTGAFAKCVGCVEGDPVFVNPTEADFRLGTGSSALGAADSEVDAYGMFLARYNVDIRYDRNGNPRPGTGWDMGAYQTGEGGPPPACN